VINDKLPVSQTCALMTLPSRGMHLDENSTPIVVRESTWNVSVTNLDSIFVFPTPESPTKTTRNHNWYLWILLYRKSHCSVLTWFIIILKCYDFAKRKKEWWRMTLCYCIHHMLYCSRNNSCWIKYLWRHFYIPMDQIDLFVDAGE